MGDRAHCRHTQARRTLSPGTLPGTSAANAASRHQHGSVKLPVAAGTQSLGPPQSGQTGSGSGVDGVDTGAVSARPAQPDPPR